MAEKVKAKAAPKRARFTKAVVQALPVPAKGRTYIYDAKTPGLALCVSEAGSRTWYVYRWVQGRPERIRLGKFPDLSVENARTLTRAIVGDIASGKDPMSERRKAREVPTLREVFRVWLDTHAKAHKKTWATDERMFAMYFTRLAGRRLNSIRTAEVALWHHDIGEKHGQYQANRCYQLLRAVYHQAKNMVGYRGESPCAGVKQFREEKRDRFLQPDELPRFFTAVENTQQPYRDFFLLLLFTGARRRNVEAMRREDISLEMRLWRIPGAVAKGGKVIVVPLVDQAVEILTRRLGATNGSPWVFPSGDPARPSKTGHITSPDPHWDRLLARAGLKDLRMHDIRRSFGAWQAISGGSLLAIGKSLGHTNLRSTEVYARLTDQSVRDSVERGTAAMLALVNGKREEVQGNGTK